MEWRRMWAGWLSTMAVSILIGGPYFTKAFAALTVGGAVYCALGYLRRGS